MGYSVGVRARSERLQKQMLAFLREQYRPWPALTGKKALPTMASDPGDDLAYDQAKRVIGFDYNSSLSGWERPYVYAICKWVSIQVGQRKSRFAKDVVTPNVMDKPVPFIVYDGHESWPVLVTTSKKAGAFPMSIRWCVVDNYGVTVGLGWRGHYVTSVIDIFTQGAQWNSMVAELGKLGHPSAGDRRFERYLRKREAIQVRYSKGEIDRETTRIRSEIRRLDRLWKALGATP